MLNIIFFFFAAAQYQQGWAFANNVNLLAANTNDPHIGCSGSGIYSGRSGALNVFVSQTPATKVLIAEVPADVSTDSLSQKVEQTKKLLANEKLSKSRAMNAQEVTKYGREDFSKYSMKFLDFSDNPVQTGEVCVNDFCCEYSIEVNDLGLQKGKVIFFVFCSFIIAYFFPFSSHLIRTRFRCSMMFVNSRTKTVQRPVKMYAV